MQIGRHRRGRRHGVRQPEMERELRALGEGADEHQHQDRADTRHARGSARPRPAPGRGRSCPTISPMQQHRREQAQAAGGGDRERHAGAAARFGAVVPVGDQHERGEAGELPEHHHLDEVAGQHDAEHRAHEREQEREEARHRIGGRQVVARVEDHQRADAGDQHREDPGVAVHAQLQVEPELRQPWQAGAHHAAAFDLRIERDQQRHAGERARAGEPRLGIARIRWQQRGADAAEERQQQDQCQRHAEILGEARVRMPRAVDARCVMAPSARTPRRSAASR